MNEAGWRTTLIVPEHALFGRELSSFSLTYQTNTSRFCCTASASSCMFTENGNACSRFSRQFHLVTTKIYRSEIPYCPKRPIQRTDVPSSHYRPVASPCGIKMKHTLQACAAANGLLACVPFARGEAKQHAPWELERYERQGKTLYHKTVQLLLSGRSVVPRSAPLRSALLRLVRVSAALLRLAPLRSLSLRFASLRSVSLRSAI
jgi:hypothetical protein